MEMVLAVSLFEFINCPCSHCSCREDWWHGMITTKNVPAVC